MTLLWVSSEDVVKNVQTPKVFGVSSVTVNSGFLRTGSCLSNAPCYYLERVTVVYDINTNCVTIIERIISTGVYEKCQ